MNKTAGLRNSPLHPSPRDEVIESCLPLVRSVAARLRAAHGLSAPFEDLYALGVTGLMQAAERFDPSRGASFTTFAYYRIRGAILDGLRRDPALQQVHVGRREVSVAAMAPGLMHAAPANDNGRPHRVDATAEDPSPSSNPSWVDRAPVHLTSLDELAALPDESALHPDEEVERRWAAERVRAALAALPDIERQVVELYYYEDLSFAEIGARLGICKPWAFRLHRRALAQLQAALAGLSESAESGSCS